MTIKQRLIDNPEFRQRAERGDSAADIHKWLGGVEVVSRPTVERACRAIRGNTYVRVPIVPVAQEKPVAVTEGGKKRGLWSRLFGDGVATQGTVPNLEPIVAQETTPINPITTPKIDPITPIVPAGSVERWICLPDLHTPFHDEALLVKVCQYIKNVKPYGIIILGDFLDLYSLSRFAADSVYSLRDVTLSGEYQTGREVLDQIEAALPPGCRKQFLWGNHEDRYWRELEKGDRGKYGDALQSPSDALRLHDRGWSVGEHWMQDSVRLGEHLDVIHGIYCPVHAAKKHLDEFQGSVLFGHTHRVQTYVSGKRAAYNIGFLGDRNSRGFHYMPRAKRMQWTNAFAEVVIGSSGDYWVNVIQCHDGFFVANGRMY